MSLLRRKARDPRVETAQGAYAEGEFAGFFGAFPDVWRDSAGFRIDGIVSHGFLRCYASTLDFDTMTMSFAEPL